MNITIRPLRTHPEYVACLALQKDTWGGGESFREAVGPAMLMVPQKIGGVTAAAFDPNGRMLGFVFGITGVRDGRPVHWSHMLAVAADAQDHDVGRRLKEYQREVLLAQGVSVMYWTYDPLVARNAHVNFMKLGVSVSEYVEDIYGSNEESTVDSVIGTDRFIVAWDLEAPAVRTPPNPAPAVGDAPLVNAEVRGGTVCPVPAPAVHQDPCIHLAIPGDIQRVKAARPGDAILWRQSTRAAFLYYLARGYEVFDFVGSLDSPAHFYRLKATHD